MMAAEREHEDRPVRRGQRASGLRQRRFRDRAGPRPLVDACVMPSIASGSTAARARHRRLARPRRRHGARARRGRRRRRAPRPASAPTRDRRASLATSAACAPLALAADLVGPRRPDRLVAEAAAASGRSTSSSTTPASSGAPTRVDVLRRGLGRGPRWWISRTCSACAARPAAACSTRGVRQRSSTSRRCWPSRAALAFRPTPPPRAASRS